MSFDTQLDAAIDTASDQTTAEAGTTDTGTAPAAPATQATAGQPERTYTRADLEAEINRTVQQRLSRRSLEEHFRNQGWVSPSEARTLRQPPQREEVDPAQQYLEQVIEAKMQERLAPLHAKEVVRDLDSGISKLTSIHPELAGKENEPKLHDVLDTVIELGFDKPFLVNGKPQFLPIDQVLEVAYRYWREYPDIETIKRQAADEALKNYTTKKVATASKTPAPEGTGGQGAVGVRQINSRKDFERALEEGIARMDT